MQQNDTIYENVILCVNYLERKYDVKENVKSSLSLQSKNYIFLFPTLTLLNNIFTV